MNYNIDPNKYYSARAVLMMGILPWRSSVTFNHRLTEPKWIEVFNPIVEQKKVNKKYHIKGENIIKFLELADSGGLYEKTRRNTKKASSLPEAGGVSN